MKLKNRKGSTLALTLMVFAVLMIFATFILGFMVTENKQAIYFQNKTQAYYIARSGAEIVEEAIKGVVATNSAANVTNFLDKIPTNDIDNPLGKTDYMVVNVSTLDYKGKQAPRTFLYKEFKTDAMYAIVIVSEAEVGGVTEILEKEILAPITIEDGVISDAPLNYITGIKPLVETWINANHKVKKVTEDEYDFFEFDTPINTFEMIKSIVVNPYTDSSEISLIKGNYRIDGGLDWSKKKLVINNEVNVYVEEYINIHDLIISGTNDPVLNVYIYGENLEPGDKSLFTLEKALNHIDGNVEVNFYVKKGNVFINLLQNQSQVFDANIIATSGVKKIELTAHSNSGKPNIIGLIYAPASEVIFGDGEGDNKASLAIKGLVIADTITYNPHNDNFNQLDKKLVITLDGIVQDETSLSNVILTVIGNGYYR